MLRADAWPGFVSSNKCNRKREPTHWFHPPLMSRKKLIEEAEAESENWL
jgi:hypothetical protein